MDTDEADYLSEEEGFIEDALTNEEYDQLYELLPQVKKALASYNDTIDELSIKEAIHYNYFELEPTLEDLKSRFPKKKGMLFSLFFSPSVLSRLAFFIPILHVPEYNGI